MLSLYFSCVYRGMDARGSLEITQEATVELLTATPHTTHRHVHFPCALQASSMYPQLNMYMLSMKQFFIDNNIIRGTLISLWIKQSRFYGWP